MDTQQELIPMSQQELHRYHTLRQVLEGSPGPRPRPVCA